MRALLRSLVSGIVLVALPTVVWAHPGHDDHDITWDFSHLAAHPWATLGCLLVLGGGVWVAWRLARRTEKTNPSGREPN